MYAKVVVFSKVPLPNYRYDLDDRRPQREVMLFIFPFDFCFEITHLTKSKGLKMFFLF